MIDYDPFSEEALRDPYPIYRRLRDESPVHFVERWDSWALSRFQDIWDVSQDSDHLTVTKGTSSPFVLTKSLPPFRNLNHMDPPSHTELRTRIAPFFMPSHVRALEDTIRGYVSECIDGFIDRGEGDLVGELAQVVAIRVGCLVVGFPEQDSRELVSFVKRFMSREEGVQGMTPDGIDAFAEMCSFLGRVADDQRGNTGEPRNPIDALLRAASEGLIPQEEVGQHLALLLIGATETFPKAFANAVVLLDRHPDQRKEMAEDPGLIPGGLRECLRVGMPTQFLMRTVAKPYELHGHSLSPGQSIMLMYASGNLDEREFEDPDRFDIHRISRRILTFGHGTHRCLGAFIAEMEGRVMLEELLGRIPDHEVDLTGARRDVTEFIQGYSCLPIRFAAAR
jgi:cytochrome P450